MPEPRSNPPPRPDRTIHLPSQVYLDRLVAKAQALGIDLQKSEINELWFYYPPERAIAIWEPDLYLQPLDFVLMLLAHEIGHVIDFDAHPELVELTRNLHFSQVPMYVEVSGFVTGYRVIQEAAIPLSIADYTFYIDEPLAGHVRAALTAEAESALAELLATEQLAG